MSLQGHFLKEKDPKHLGNRFSSCIFTLTASVSLKTWTGIQNVNDILNLQINCKHYGKFLSPFGVKYQ